jgi:hypothetical protein
VRRNSPIRSVSARSERVLPRGSSSPERNLSLPFQSASAVRVARLGPLAPVLKSGGPAKTGEDTGPARAILATVEASLAVGETVTVSVPNGRAKAVAEYLSACLTMPHRYQLAEGGVRFYR